MNEIVDETPAEAPRLDKEHLLNSLPVFLPRHDGFHKDLCEILRSPVGLTILALFEEQAQFAARAISELDFTHPNAMMEALKGQGKLKALRDLQDLLIDTANGEYKNG